MTLALEELNTILEYREDSLCGKWALVTGASAGFGLAIAARLAQAGVNLVLSARRVGALEELKSALQAKFAKVQIKILGSDVCAEDFVAKLEKINGLDVDIFINNAGLARGLEPVAEANLQDWREMIDTNITAAFFVTRAVIPKMIARGGGHVVAMASIAGHETYEKGGVYCATKHALIAFHKALRQETCGQNIRVTLISPGMAKTEFSEVRFHGDKSRAESVYAGVKPLLAADIAHQVMFCLNQPSHVDIDEIRVTCAQQGSATKVARK